MKTRASLYEGVASIIALLLALALGVAVRLSAELKMELPGLEWVMWAMVGITVFCFGMLYLFCPRTYFPVLRWRKVTLIVSASIAMLHTLVIVYAAIMAYRYDTMWLLTADILDNQICFFLVLFPSRSFWTDVGAYLIMGGLWYACAVVCGARLVGLIAKSCCFISERLRS